jgi:uncharacterized membrane protein
MEHPSKDKTEKQTPMYTGTGLVFGSAIGAIFGMLLFNQLAIGAGVGAAIGLLIGAGIDAQRSKESVQ